MGEISFNHLVLHQCLISYQIAAIVETDVLRNNRFEANVITRRRELHFMKMYRKIISWFRKLRNGTPIVGLSAESRAQAVHGIDVLSDLSLPDLAVFHS